MSRVTTLDMEKAADEAKELRQRFLEQHGWKYTCKTPGSFWLWEKTLADGRVILVETGMAVSMSECLDTQLAWASKHDFGEEGDCARCRISLDDFERSEFKAACSTGNGGL